MRKKFTYFIVTLIFLLAIFLYFIAKDWFVSDRSEDTITNLMPFDKQPSAMSINASGNTIVFLDSHYHKLYVFQHNMLSYEITDFHFDNILLSPDNKTLLLLDVDFANEKTLLYYFNLQTKEIKSWITLDEEYYLFDWKEEGIYLFKSQWDLEQMDSTLYLMNKENQIVPVWDYEKSYAIQDILEDWVLYIDREKEEIRKYNLKTNEDTRFNLYFENPTRITYNAKFLSTTDIIGTAVNKEYGVFTYKYNGSVTEFLTTGYLYDNTDTGFVIWDSDYINFYNYD